MQPIYVKHKKPLALFVINPSNRLYVGCIADSRKIQLPRFYNQMYDLAGMIQHADFNENNEKYQDLGFYVADNPSAEKLSFVSNDPNKKFTDDKFQKEVKIPNIRSVAHVGYEKLFDLVDREIKNYDISDTATAYKAIVVYILGSPYIAPEPEDLDKLNSLAEQKGILLISGQFGKQQSNNITDDRERYGNLRILQIDINMCDEALFRKNFHDIWKQFKETVAGLGNK